MISPSCGDGRHPVSDLLNRPLLVGTKMKEPKEKTHTQNPEKTLVQQVFHPALFNRPRSSSLSRISTSSSNRLEAEPDLSQLANTEPTPSTSHNITNQPPPWQKVPALRATKRKKTSSPSPEKVNVTNRFTGLPMDEEEEDSETVKQTPKPPPIILYGIEDVNKLTEILVEVVNKNDFVYKIITKNQLRISCTTVETYKNVMDAVRQQGLIGHTFNRKDKRAYRVVIRNLHHTTPINIIKETLEGTGNTVVGEIINVKYGPEKLPTSTFFANLAQSPNNKAVKNVKYIYHQSVVIEDPRKRKSVVQCQRCQQYGHTKNYCMRPYRCVKCAQDHKTADCPKIDRNTPATCALCQGAHPANYKGCEVYKEILARKSNKQRNPRQQSENTKADTIPTIQRPPQNLFYEDLRPNANTDTNTGQRYADVLKTNKNKDNEDKVILNKTIEEMFIKQTEKMDLILQQMSTLISLITTLVSKIAK